MSLKIVSDNVPKAYIDARLSLLVSDQESWTSKSPDALVRSKSAEQLQSENEVNEVLLNLFPEQEYNKFAQETMSRMQILAIAVSMMESGLENEFLLALHLLNKVLDVPTAQKMHCLAKFDKMVSQLEWKNFNGIVSLITRGIDKIPHVHLNLSVTCPFASLHKSKGGQIELRDSVNGDDRGARELFHERFPCVDFRAR